MLKSKLYKMMTAETVFFVLLGASVLVSGVFAQSGESYSIVWSTIDGGGGQSSGGPYILTGTIGQPDAGRSAGGSFEMLGGFWVGESLYFVDFHDFSRFSLYWMQSGTGIPADMYPDDTVNADDLLEFANWWLCIRPDGWPLK